MSTGALKIDLINQITGITDKARLRILAITPLNFRISEGKQPLKMFM